MTDSSKNTNAPQNENDISINSNPNKISVENIPVYSMKRDLEAIKSGQMITQKIPLPQEQSSEQARKTEPLAPSPFQAEKQREIKPAPYHQEEVSPRKPPQEISPPAEQAPQMVKKAEPLAPSPFQAEKQREIKPVSYNQAEIFPKKQPKEVSYPVTQKKEVEIKTSFGSPTFKDNEKTKMPPLPTDVLKVTEKEPVSHNFWGKTVAWAIAIIIIAVIAGGGYYFWATKLNKPANPPKVVVAPPEDLPQKQPEPEPAKDIEPIAPYFKDKPNYLNIDASAKDPAKIKEVINEAARKISEFKYDVPVEFAIVDVNNNPVNINVFNSLLGLNLTKETIGYLRTDSQNYSLFVNNDSSVTRLGLVIGTNNAVGLKTALQKEEKTLVQNLKGLFMTDKYTLDSKKVFATSDYGGTAIRFLNISLVEPLSVDYAIHKGNLVIGTSKMTIRSIIDKLSTRQEN